MGKKKETGGLISDDLLQPGDDQVLDNNNLIDTTKTEEEKNKKQDPVSVLGQSFFGPNAGQISRQLANPYTGSHYFFHPEDITQYGKLELHQFTSSIATSSGVGQIISPVELVENKAFNREEQ